MLISKQEARLESELIKRVDHYYITHCQESLVKQHNDPKQWEENSKSSQAQPNLCWPKTGHRRFSKSWEKLMRCTLQVCNISTAEGAEVSQTSIRKPVYSIYCIMSVTMFLYQWMVPPDQVIRNRNHVPCCWTTSDSCSSMDDQISTCMTEILNLNARRIRRGKTRFLYQPDCMKCAMRGLLIPRA